MEKITLPNGFRIILEPVDWARSATMGIWVGSGSRYETPQTAGVSHFIEHMLFKGTARRSALAIAEQMDEIGGALTPTPQKNTPAFMHGHSTGMSAPPLISSAICSHNPPFWRKICKQSVVSSSKSYICMKIARRIFARIISMPVFGKGYARLQHLGRAKNRLLPNSG